MQKIDVAEMTTISAAGGSRNCGNAWQTKWVITTCGLAGGMIGLAAAGLGASIGSLAGSTTCAWICYYAC